MYRCFECGHLFESGEELHITEAHGERYTGCPVCGGGYEETVQCTNCGANHFDDDVYFGFCIECLGAEATYDNMKNFLHDKRLEADFYICEFYKSNIDPDCVSEELTDLARCGFNSKVCFDMLKNRGVKGYESPLVGQMRKYLFDLDDGVYSFAEWLTKKKEEMNRGKYYGR